MTVVGGVGVQSAGRETVVQWNGKSTIQFRTLNCCCEIFFLYAWIMPSNWASRWHVHLLFFDNTQQQEPKKKNENVKSVIKWDDFPVNDVSQCYIPPPLVPQYCHGKSM